MTKLTEILLWLLFTAFAMFLFIGSASAEECKPETHEGKVYAACVWEPGELTFSADTFTEFLDATDLDYVYEFPVTKVPNPANNELGTICYLYSTDENKPMSAVICQHTDHGVYLSATTSLLGEDA